MQRRQLLVPLVAALLGGLGVEGPASAAPLARQSFRLVSDINEETVRTVVASGAINASGQDVVVSDTEDQFVFPDGALTVIHVPVRGKDHFNENRCSGTFRERGTYVISEGTGLYEGVTGSGTYRVVASFEGNCVDPPSGTVTITARGSINLPNP
jgi:hypothetical protein